MHVYTIFGQQLKKKIILKNGRNFHTKNKRLAQIRRLPCLNAWSIIAVDVQLRKYGTSQQHRTWPTSGVQEVKLLYSGSEICRNTKVAIR